MPEIRKDAVVGRWVVFSPERLRRPVNSLVMEKPEPGTPDSDPFSEGNEQYTPPEVFAIRHEGSEPNGPGWQVRVVPNRFPALRIEGSLDKEAVGFYDRVNGVGAHEVVIESPKTDEALEDQKLAGVANVLKAYRKRAQDLSHDKRFRYVLVFKNVGALAGASIFHAHSQIIALPMTPTIVREKLITAQKYYLQKDRNIFEDILRNELKTNERLVFENAGFAAFCPFASRFPFEMCIMPRLQSPHFHESDDHQLFLLADAIRKVLRALREAAGAPDYNLIIHTAPIKRTDKPDMQTSRHDYRWHIEILPRLTGIAGFEFGTGFHINPVLPEEAARVLKEVIAHD
ncbi:MAG: DUF4931 domain-containing protein [Verrucomicrobiota bacterium]